MGAKVGKRKLGSLRTKNRTNSLKTENYHVPCGKVIKLEFTECVMLGPKTAACRTKEIISLDPPRRSHMGPFFFGDSKGASWIRHQPFYTI